MPALFVGMLIAGWAWTKYMPQVGSTQWLHYEGVLQDNLASNFSGKGLQFDFSDAERIAALAGSDPTGNYNWVYTFDAAGETTANFPGAPFLQYAGRQAFGDERFLLGSLASWLLALSLAVLINLVRIRSGWLAASLATLFLIADVAIHQSVFFAGGDTLVMALVVLAFVAFTHGVNNAENGLRSIWPWPFAGALLGATTLFQAPTNLWLVLIFLVWLVSLAFKFLQRKLNEPNEHAIKKGSAIEPFVLFWIGVMLIAAPWWIRNCKTTGKFQPIGVEVQTNLVGAYSDGALATSGNIDVPGVFEFREQELRARAKIGDTTLVEKEAWVANQSVTHTRNWIRDNGGQLPGLVTSRIANHFGVARQQYELIQIFNAVMIVGALVGYCLAWRKFGSLVFTLLLFSTVVTAITWSDHGRQLLPLRALMDAMCGIGIARVLGLVLKQIQRKPV